MSAGFAPRHRAALLAWFDQNRRDLPWRRTRDAYAIWLSEVMLQQTQVATVIPYWERFLAAFPTLELLAKAPLDEVLALWKGLGYYSRARNLHRAAQVVAARHGGKLPSTRDELRALPGFGPYTAGAVASIAFEEAAPLVDGNVARVFSRLFAVEGLPGAKVREARLWQLAETWVQGPRPGDWNQALMELGALVCKPERPDCGGCPVRSACVALETGRVEELPPKKVRAEKKRLLLATAVWRRGDQLLFARRRDGGLFGGLWELPTAEVKSAREARPRLSEALGTPLRVGRSLGRVKRVLTHRELELALFPVDGENGARATGPTATQTAFSSVRWATAAEAEALAMSTAMKTALALVLAPKQPRSRRA